MFNRNNKGSFLAFVISMVAIASCILLLHACAPTYPKEELPGAVKTVCKVEYDMDVDVTVVGDTIGIYYPMEGLLDAGMGISKDAWDKISNLILIASRVVLSTDAEIEFYCVVTQDVRLPELQVVIIKYVDDVKMGMYRNISRNESFKRTLFSINLTPQAKKERSIETVFDKIGVDEETRQKVMNEFFRSTPTKLTDIGYWKGQFYLKDITTQEFLAAQMANRIKIDFRSGGELEKLFIYKSAEGVFSSGAKDKFFFLTFKIADANTPEAAGINLREKKIEEILAIAHEVVYGYKFTDFDFLLMDDQLENAKLKVTGKDVYNYDRNKFPVEEMVKAPADYFSQINAQ